MTCRQEKIFSQKKLLNSVFIIGNHKSTTTFKVSMRMHTYSYTHKITHCQDKAVNLNRFPE